MVKLTKFILLVLLLNLTRYVIGGPIEGVVLMEPMHAVMPQYPEVFDTEFGNTDFAVSLFYNFMMWLTAAWVFYLAHPSLKGGYVVRSLKVFGLMGLFFVSLAAVYMNHYTADIKTFYLYSMLDAVILFPLVGLANGWLFPRIFRRRLAGAILNRNFKNHHCRPGCTFLRFIRTFVNIVIKFFWRIRYAAVTQNTFYYIGFEFDVFDLSGLVRISARRPLGQVKA